MQSVGLLDGRGPWTQSVSLWRHPNTLLHNILLLMGFSLAFPLSMLRVRTGDGGSTQWGSTEALSGWEEQLWQWEKARERIYLALRLQSELELRSPSSRSVGNFAGSHLAQVGISDLSLSLSSLFLYLPYSMFPALGRGESSANGSLYSIWNTLLKWWDLSRHPSHNIGVTAGTHDAKED